MVSSRKKIKNRQSPDKAYLCVYVGDLLYCASLACRYMPSANNTAVGALTKLLDELVLGIDLENAVERGERDPSHGRQGEGGP